MKELNQKEIREYLRTAEANCGSNPEKWAEAATYLTWTCLNLIHERRMDDYYVAEGTRVLVANLAHVFDLAMQGADSMEYLLEFVGDWTTL